MRKRKNGNTPITLESLSGQVETLAQAVAKGFGSVDSRFTGVDRRFTEVDRRFDKMEARQSATDEHVRDLATETRERFDAVDKQLGRMEERMDNIVQDVDMLAHDVLRLKRRGNES